jgi:hypothetical protein
VVVESSGTIPQQGDAVFVGALRVYHERLQADAEELISKGKNTPADLSAIFMCGNTYCFKLCTNRLACCSLGLYLPSIVF